MVLEINGVYLTGNSVLFESLYKEGDKMVKTKCEVYSRVVGYIRPVSNWNDSKQAEFSDRKKYDSAVKETCKC